MIWVALISSISKSPTLRLGIAVRTAHPIYTTNNQPKIILVIQHERETTMMSNLSKCLLVDSIFSIMHFIAKSAKNRIWEKSQKVDFAINAKDMGSFMKDNSLLGNALLAKITVWNGFYVLDVMQLAYPNDYCQNYEIIQFSYLI